MQGERNKRHARAGWEDKMEIHASGKFDYRTMKALQKVTTGTQTTVMTAVLSACTVFTAGLAVVRIMNGSDARYSIMGPVLVLGMLIVWIATAAYLPKKAYNQLGKRAEMITEYVFRDDDFAVDQTEPGFNGSSTVSYNQLTRVVETPEFFFLYITKTTAHPVDKATFKGGAAEQLAARLRTANVQYVVKKR